MLIYGNRINNIIRSISSLNKRSCDGIVKETFIDVGVVSEEEDSVQEVVHNFHVKQVISSKLSGAVSKPNTKIGGMRTLK